MNHDHTTLEQFLGDSTIRSMVKEFGLENETPEAQAYIVDKLNLYIFEKVVLEIVKALPETDREAFESHIGSGDFESLRALLKERIPEYDSLIQETAKDAYTTAQEMVTKLRKAQ